MALVGTTVFVATGAGLEAVDGLTGKTVHLWVPRRELVPGNWPATPYVSNTGDKSVVAGYIVHTRGVGTTAPLCEIELQEVNAAGDRLEADFTVPTPNQDALGGLRIVEATNRYVTLLIGDSGQSGEQLEQADGDIAVEVDMQRHRILWTATSFIPAAGNGAVVVGSAVPVNMADPYVIEARDRLTGKLRWKDDEPMMEATVFPSGKGAVLVEGNDYATGGGLFEYVPMLSGKPLVLAKPGTTTDTWQCFFDGDRTDACGNTSGSSAAFAVDAATGALLWGLPDSAHNRVAPNVTFAWRGMVYGSTNWGNVVLDIRTGKDVDDAPGISPVVCDDYIGLADATRQTPNGPETVLMAYPA
ncbi:MAG TPA: hypothetical protein VFN61_12880 [Acidimicrobiales bacterium]|nr:hypothetical protein [Acidimicrobiales bacterium]